MTVRELIEILSKHDPEKEVLFSDCAHLLGVAESQNSVWLYDFDPALYQKEDE